MGFPGGVIGKESTCQGRRCKRHGSNPWVQNIPWRRAWQPTPVLLSGKSQWSLAGYSPRGSQKVGHDWACPHALSDDPARRLEPCVPRSWGMRKDRQQAWGIKRRAAASKHISTAGEEALLTLNYPSLPLHPTSGLLNPQMHPKKSWWASSPTKSEIHTFQSDLPGWSSPENCNGRTYWGQCLTQRNDDWMVGRGVRSFWVCFSSSDTRGQRSTLCSGDPGLDMKLRHSGAKKLGFVSALNNCLAHIYS